MTSQSPRTLLEKIWSNHRVVEGQEGEPDVLFIDLHLIHEVTSPQAFTTLRERDLKVARPERTLGTIDHSIPTRPGWTPQELSLEDPTALNQMVRLQGSCAEHGIPLLGWGHPNQGIVHVIAPELGFVHPGSTIVCGDSHTSTHGAFGALAFGVGTSEVTQVLATQCLLQKRPRNLEIRMDGTLASGVSAKDMILFLISKLGTDGARGTVIEYRGDTVTALGMEARMTLCNMSIEAGARAGLIAPDETTFRYLNGRRGTPRGESWERALEDWRQLPSDEGAVFDASHRFDASMVEPMITWGTSPGMAMSIGDTVPDLHHFHPAERSTVEKAYSYLQTRAGESFEGKKLHMVFLGSCTNGRLSDLQEAANLLDGRRVASGTLMWVVPGSQQVKSQAEALGLHDVFLAAGAQWREPGCSLCLAMNGDRVASGNLSLSTSNRNFEGRQGPGSRTILASPLTAAASAIRGRVTDPREFLS